MWTEGCECGCWAQAVLVYQNKKGSGKSRDPWPKILRRSPLPPHVHHPPVHSPSPFPWSVCPTATKWRREQRRVQWTLSGSPGPLEMSRRHFTSSACNTTTRRSVRDSIPFTNSSMLTGLRIPQCVRLPGKEAHPCPPRAQLATIPLLPDETRSDVKIALCSARLHDTPQIRSGFFLRSREHVISRKCR